MNTLATDLPLCRRTGMLFRRLSHRLAHALCLETGAVVSWWEPDLETARELWVGFKCATCGQTTGAHRSRYW